MRFRARIYVPHRRLVSRGHTLLKNRKGLVNCPHYFRSVLQNLEEHTFTVLLMGRVRLDNERGRDHKTRALQCFTISFFNCMLARLIAAPSTKSRHFGAESKRQYSGYFASAGD